MESPDKAAMVKRQREESPDSEKKKKMLAEIKKDLLLYNFEKSRFLWLFSVMILEC